jgi:sulfate/thiosulfate transport system substrate-binding protein
MLSDLVKNQRMRSTRLHAVARRHSLHQVFGRRGVVTLLGVVAAGSALVGLVGLVGLAGPAGASGGTVNLVAYSTPKAAFGAEVAAFQATKAGNGVSFSQSFAASGTQANGVVSGLPADVVNFSTTLDMTKLVTAGLVSKTWDKNSTSGMVTNSIVSFIVRKGNPKHIKTWADLIKPGVQVVTPNPFSSGSAKWNLLAGYGAQTNTGHSPAQARAYLTKLLKATVSQPSSASNALQAFLSGQGDVLLDYQDDATYAVNQGAPITVVTPPQSILIQNPIALTTAGAKNSAAKAFYAFVLSPAGQKIWAEQGYQPVLASVAKKFKFAEPKTVFTIASLGGWTNINTTFFDPSTGTVAKIESGLGVSTASG